MKHLTLHERLDDIEKAVTNHWTEIQRCQEQLSDQKKLLYYLLAAVLASPWAAAIAIILTHALS